MDGADMNLNFRVGLPLLAAPLLIGLTQAPTLALAQAATPPAAAAPAATPPAAPAAPAGDAAAGAAPYKVVDGDKVDDATFEGWKTWRAMACERCHGANQEGLVGPSLVNSLKTMSKKDFVFTVTHGRVEKGMPNFGTVPTVVKNIDNLYAYLKGRSDGAIKPGHLHKMDAPQ
jgi:mono/diheme cytochrome c family protein